MTGTGARIPGRGRTAERIKAARQAAGWSQEQLARKLDVTVGNIRVIERGDRLPSLAMAIRLERLFRQPMADFIDFEEVVSSTTKANVARSSAQLTPATKRGK